VRYKIKSNIFIRTENAAKPRAQHSKFLKKKILDLEPVASSFDYGCGKLRYSDFILKTTDTLTLVDSEIQISRDQKLPGKRTTIRRLFSSSNQISVCNTIEFGSVLASYDRAFCINVLSVIPRKSIRRRVVSLIENRLNPGGTCLFVVQYRNSDFSRMRALPNAEQWADGYIIDSFRGYSFYGLISPQQLSRLVTGAGFKVLDLTLNEGSVYLLAKTAKSAANPRVFNIREEGSFQIT
jgi:SAM-dependent methyltransferase